MKRNKRASQEMAWKLTHTDKRRVKGTMKGMKANGRKQKNNARKMAANDRNVKRT